MMAFTNLIVQQTYVADGVLVNFTIPFQIIQSDSAEVAVYTRDDSQTPTVKTLMVAGSDYDLSGRPTPFDFNTTVTFRVAPLANLKVILERVIALTQPFDPQTNGAIVLKDHNTAYDRAVGLIQQLGFRLTKTLGFNNRSNFANYEIPDPLPNRIIGFSADGLSIRLMTAGDIFNLDGALAISKNLSDLSNVSQALLNLGISPLSTLRRFTFTDGQAATNLLAETWDAANYTSIVYECEIIRGTTIVSYQKFILQYENGTWQIALAEMVGRADHGLTFSLSQVGTIGQLRVAASSSGGGNGTIKAKTHPYGV